MNTLLVFTKAYRHCLLQYSANTLYTSANGLQLHDRASKGTCPLQQNSCSRPVTTQILEAHFSLCLESISHSSRTISHHNLATSIAKQTTEHLLLQEVSTKLTDSSQGRCSTPSSPHIRTVAANLYFSEQVALLPLEHLLLSGGQYIHRLTMSTLLIQNILLVHHFQRLKLSVLLPLFQVDVCG